MCYGGLSLGPAASLPSPDPWPMRGENLTARELWQLDSAVARDFLIKIAEGLVQSDCCLFVFREIVTII